MRTTIFGVSGDPGSFAEEAAFLYAKRFELHPILSYLQDMEAVVSAVESGGVDFGIFPIINFYGGWVKSAFQAMGRHMFHPIDEQWLEVNHCLLTCPGTSLNQIKTVISHPQALAQCKHYLEKNFNGISCEEGINTARSAKDLALGHLSPTTAVIASAKSADLYGLNILAKNIQDKTPNITVFIVVKKWVNQ